jgi:hypothetical protein
VPPIKARPLRAALTISAMTSDCLSTVFDIGIP